ncbi:hypothetical protein K2X96_02885 [Patescibacteria group bacterium]|nr:hypothetical protein [Patescibacteria group bacterium]
MSTSTYHTRGYLIIYALVFGAILFSFLVAFIGFIVIENGTQRVKMEKEGALQIAEAGLDYYKWYLSHFPTDVTNGTGSPGPYVHSYEDPELGVIGEFSLDVEANTVCGDIASIDIHSTGTIASNPDISRTVYGRYARPTVAEFAYIINSNVWAGADRVIMGPYHSNGGVRMDGTNQSTVSSGVETWLCTPGFGCSPTTTRNGVFGAGPNNDLWSFPSPPISFTGLSVDLALIKAKAQGSGRYFAPSGNFGYHIVFRNNGTFDLYRVTGTQSVAGYTTEAGWASERHIISSQTLVGNYTIPPSCSVIFVEDKLWIDGTLTNKVTVAAANVITAGVAPDLILEGNITYATSTAGLLAVGEGSVLIPLDSPDVMTINGIFVAQTGRFGRNHYCQSECDSDNPGNEGVSNALDPYVTQTSLTVNGTIVSNGREGTKWTSGATVVSGYQTRTNSYDRKLVSDPPPLTPYTSDTYKFIEWREEN